MTRIEPSKLAVSFVDYLKEQELYNELPAIVQTLQDELYRNRDIIVISARELTSEEKTQLDIVVTTKWGEHHVVYTVDTSLVSGFIIKFMDQVIDASGRGDLANLAEHIKA